MIVAAFSPGQECATVRGLWQWDYGRKLRIQGLDLPTAVEIQFSLQKTGGETESRIGVTKDGVTDVPIPDFVLENRGATQDYYAYAFIYLTDETSGQTVKMIVMEIKARSKPEPFDKPEGAELFREAIQAVNECAERAETAETSAGAWAHGHENYPERDEDNAKYYADQAKENARQTGEDLTEVQQLAETVALAEGNVSADKEAVAELKEQTQAATQNALLSEKNAKASETASQDAQAGAETAEEQTELLAKQVESDRNIVEQAKSLVVKLGQEVTDNRTSVEKTANEFKIVAQQAVNVVNNAGQEQVERVENTGAQVVKEVNDAGAKQVSAVTEEGSTQVANVQEAAAGIIADREQIQQNKQDIGELKGDLQSKLTKPDTAKVGQIFRVQSITEDGNIVLESVDMPSGAVNDVQIDGTSIVGENGVAEIPTLKRGKFGLPFVESNDSSRESNGIDVDDRFGNIKVIPSPTWRIDDRATNTVITPNNLDYAVKASVCDGKGKVWTTEEQAAARERFGIYSNFELVNTITITEEISLLSLDTTDSGEAYDYSDVEIIINIPITSLLSVRVHFNNIEVYYPYVYFNAGNSSYETFYKIRSIGTSDRVLVLATYHTNSIDNNGTIVNTSSINNSNFIGRFKIINFVTDSVFPIGTKIEIYGKR